MKDKTNSTTVKEDRQSEGEKIADALDLPPTGFIRQAQLIPDVLPFSSATLWRMVKSGDFPRPVRLSRRVTAWRVSDVRLWIAQLAS